MGIKIGHITVENRVVLAPMSGITDAPFRSQVHKFGPNLVFSEMIPSTEMLHLLKTNKQNYRKEFKSKRNAPIGFQIAGWDPYIMGEAASVLEDFGASIIDINMGCPAKKVVKRYAGSALMKDLSLAEKIVTSVVNATSIPVTLKMRTGWDEETKNAPQLAKIAEDNGIKMLTVHGRTRNQFYKGNADWKFISSVKAAVGLPVIANGDITSIQGACTCLEVSNADGIMIGRGANGQPWLLSQISAFIEDGSLLPSPQLEQQMAILLEHFDSMLSHYGNELGTRLSRKHIAWYTKGLPSSTDFRQKIFTKHDPRMVKKSICELYDFAQSRLAV